MKYSSLFLIKQFISFYGSEAHFLPWVVEFEILLLLFLVVFAFYAGLYWPYPPSVTTRSSDHIFDQCQMHTFLLILRFEFHANGLSRRVAKTAIDSGGCYHLYNCRRGHLNAIANQARVRTPWEVLGRQSVDCKPLNVVQYYYCCYCCYCCYHYYP